MYSRNYFYLIFLAAFPALPQVSSTPFEVPTRSADESLMAVPPLISGEGYPKLVGSEMRSNYVAASFNLNTAYDDNVLVGRSTTQSADEVYSVSSAITLNQITSRQQIELTYHPGFTFYQHNGVLNAFDQTAALDYQYRLSPHMTISLQDSFHKSSNALSQLYPSFGGGASLAPPPANVVAPYADQLSNTANVGLDYQFNRNGMIGAHAITLKTSYPNQTQASGFYNSNSYGSSAFYNHHISAKQYIGVTYQYLSSESTPVNSQVGISIESTMVHTHTVFGIYSIYLSPSFSISVAAGPQYFNATQFPLPSSSSLVPAAMASLGWQKNRTNFSASYMRTVSGGTGLPGAYESGSANASARLRFARSWTTGLATTYSINKNATSLLSSNSGGHSLSGVASLQYSINEHLTAEFGYVHMQQSYSSIEAIAGSPDSNRVFIAISYQLTRSLGR